MNCRLDRSVKVPAYLQLYSQIREAIVKELYPCGTKLPSKRLLAEETGASLVTVEHAYTLLAEEGYIEPRERSGYFVIFDASAGFAAAPSAPRAPSPLPPAPTVSDFPFSVLTKTMRRVMTDHGEAILEKSPNAGHPSLREALRDYLARNRGISAESSQIIIGSGAEYLYGLLVELLGRDKVFAMESPSYHKIEQVYRASDVVCERLPLSSDGIDSRALAASSADVLHTTPYRSFPTGVTASASKRHEYIRWARGGRFLVEDDYESEFSVTTKPVETLFALSEEENVIYLNTFTKTISPALRVGYMVLPPPLAKRFEETLGFYSCTVPTFEQLVLAELIRRGDFERHINRVRRRKRQEGKT